MCFSMDLEVKQFSRELHRVNKHRAGKAQLKPQDPLAGSRFCKGFLDL